MSFILDVAPTGMSIDALSGLIQWIPDSSQVGDNAVTVRVEDDGGLFDTQSFTIAVAETPGTTTRFSDIDSGLISPTGEYRGLDVADQPYSEDYRIPWVSPYRRHIYIIRSRRGDGDFIVHLSINIKT